MAMPDQPLTLATLEAYLAQKHQRASFPPAIETVYDEQMSSYRLEVMESGILRAIIVYNVFLPLHFLVLPRTAIIALLLHLGVITPAIFAVGWLYRVLHRQVLRQAAAAIIPWLMVTRQIEDLAIPHNGVGQLGVVTISLGVIAGPTAVHDFVELVTAADAALYAAKRGGRNQVWPPFVARDNPVALLKKTASRSRPSRDRSNPA
jgi:hypothetical protein